MNSLLRFFLPSPAASIAVCAALLLQGLASSSVLAADDNWTTPLASKLGVRLEAQFDSGGPDAWDPKKHPLVFVTSEGPG